MVIKTSYKDIIWSYIGTIVSLGSNFLLLPFILKFLNSEQYGLWTLFVSLGGITVLFDFGFNSVFARNIAYCWSGSTNLTKSNVAAVAENAEVNYGLLKKVLKTCKVIYLVISLSASFVLLLGGTGYVYFISQGKVASNEAVIAWIVYAVGVILNLYYGYYDAYLLGIGLVGDVNKARTLSKVLQMFFSILFLFMGCGLLGVSIAYVGYGIIFRQRCRSKFNSYHDLRVRLRNEKSPNRNEIIEIFKTVWYSTWREGIVSISNYICNQVTTILCSLFLGLSDTGRYGLAVQLSNAVGQISVSLFRAYQPMVQQLYAKRDFKELRKSVSIGIRTLDVLFPLGISAVIVIFVPILKLIKPESVVDISVLLCVSFYHFLIGRRDCYAWYLAGTNRMIYYKGFLVSAVVCMASSVILTGFLGMGLTGFIISQIGSQIVYNAWHWQILVDSELKLTAKDKWCFFIDYIKNTATEILNKVRTRK